MQLICLEEELRSSPVSSHFKTSAPHLLGYGNDSALCRARHKPDYAEYIIMLSSFISPNIYRPYSVMRSA
jgi:hypothetical protein